MYYIGTMHVLAGHTDARLPSRFQRLPFDALSTARIAHLHGVGDGRRNRGAKRCFEVLDREDDVKDRRTRSP